MGGRRGTTVASVGVIGIGVVGGGLRGCRPALNGTVLRVLFGEFSVRAAGVSEWTSFRAGEISAVPEPAAGWLLLAGVLLLLAIGWRAVRPGEPPMIHP